MNGTFVQNLTSLMPESMTLDPKLAKTFNWMEDQGWMQVRDGAAPEDHYLPVYPPVLFQEPYTSYAYFGGTTLNYTSHWSTPDPKVDARIFEIATTSGDGGRAAIWLDPQGKQHFVSLGHDTVGILTDDPVKFLQFMAMGYLEPANVWDPRQTPLEAALEYHDVETLADFNAISPDEPPMLPPDALQRFLKAEFGVDAPLTAADLGITELPDYDTNPSGDAFVTWLKNVTPPPTAEELAYIDELLKMAEGMEFDDLTLDDPDKPQGFIDKLKGLFRLQ